MKDLLKPQDVIEQIGIKGLCDSADEYLIRGNYTCLRQKYKNHITPITS